MIRVDFPGMVERADKKHVNTFAMFRQTFIFKVKIKQIFGV